MKTHINDNETVRHGYNRIIYEKNNLKMGSSVTFFNYATLVKKLIRYPNLVQHAEDRALLRYFD